MITLRCPARVEDWEVSVDCECEWTPHLDDVAPTQLVHPECPIHGNGKARMLAYGIQYLLAEIHEVDRNEKAPGA